MRVIAKAYGDRPLDRVVTGVTERLAYVAAPSAEYANGYPQFFGVGFPRGAVFEFNPGLFDSLRKAWEAGDHAKLRHAWSLATPVYEDAKEAA